MQLVPASSAPVAVEFDYPLPESLVAITPAEDRDHSRLLIFDRESGAKQHVQFSDLGGQLRPEDLLILNSARVEAARVEFAKPTGGEAEMLLLRPVMEEGETSCWEALVSGRNLRIGSEYALPKGRTFHIEQRGEGGFATLRLDASVDETRRWLTVVGTPPLPPYIRKERRRRGISEISESDRGRYQTVFATDAGSAAAPTAGLHFTEELLARLRANGVEIATLHLAVGWGTFQPLTEKQWASGRLHPERVEISPDTAALILDAKRQHRRIVAVGTTVVRAMEWWWQSGAPADGIEGFCDIFLRPPWRPTVIDALITNFHLPRSSLMALVAGFLGENGTQRLLDLYAEAVTRRYRFYSYGDAMLIL